MEKTNKKMEKEKMTIHNGKNGIWIKYVMLGIAIIFPAFSAYMKFRSEHSTTVERLSVIEERLKIYKSVYDKDKIEIKNQLEKLQEREDEMVKLLQEIMSRLKLIEFQLSGTKSILPRGTLPPK